MFKKIMFGLILLILIGVCTGIYLWNKPHKKVENAKGISIAATALSKEFNADEQAANTKYLNKAIEVTGAVSDIVQNQDGGVMIILSTDDPMAEVQCAMREKGAAPAKGSRVNIKGFCSGFLMSSVSLTDCIIK